MPGTHKSLDSTEWAGAHSASQLSVMQNKIIYSIVLLFLAGVIFVGGFVTAYVTKHFVGLHSISLLQQESVDAMEASLWVGKLHEGKTEEVIDHLNLQLDGSIVMMEGFLEDLPEDDENRRLAYTVLARIAEQRERHSYDTSLHELRSEIDLILKNARETAEREGITRQERERREAAPPERTP